MVGYSCPECGYKVPSVVRDCPHCGGRLRWPGTFAVIAKVVAVSVAAIGIGEELANNIINFGAKLAQGNDGLIHFWGVGLVLLGPAVTFILLAAAIAAIARFTKPVAVFGLCFSAAIMWLLGAIDLVTYSWLWTTSDYTLYAPTAPPLFLSIVYSVGGLLFMIFLVAPQCSFFRSVVEPRRRMAAGGEISVHRHPDATSKVVSRLQATTEFIAGHAIPVLFHPQDGWAAVYLANGAPGWIAMSSPVFFVHSVTLTKRLELLDTSPAAKPIGTCGEGESVDLLLREPWGKVRTRHQPSDDWTLVRTSSGQIGCFHQSLAQFVTTATSEGTNRSKGISRRTLLMFALGGVLALTLGFIGGVVALVSFSAGLSWLRFLELSRRPAGEAGSAPS